jgi:pimeloyl-ACP methyl ester carboxylesterase
VVLLHGLNGNAASWIHQYQALGERFRVVGWDAPGYGGSDPHPAPGVQTYAEVVGALLGFLTEEGRKFAG